MKQKPLLLGNNCQIITLSLLAVTQPYSKKEIYLSSNTTHILRVTYFFQTSSKNTITVLFPFVIIFSANIFIDSLCTTNYNNSKTTDMYVNIIIIVFFFICT